MINYRRTNCRLCGSKKLIAAVKLTPTPPADSYLKNELSKNLKEIPLTVMLCKDCGHSQLSHVINAKQVYLNYIYETASTLGQITILKNVLMKFIKPINLTKMVLLLILVVTMEY